MKAEGTIYAEHGRAQVDVPVRHNHFKLGSEAPASSQPQISQVALEIPQVPQDNRAYGLLHWGRNYAGVNCDTCLPQDGRWPLGACPKPGSGAARPMSWACRERLAGS